MTNEEVKNKTPVVLVHGMGGGIGLWAQNIDTLSKNRPLYAFDLLGFGRSSRPNFSKNADLAETQFVDSIEEWRKEMNLDKFVLVGHSLGGYLVSSYAMKYPEKIKHLIVVDPWGYPELPPESQRRNIPVWIRAIATIISPFNPLAVLRAAGPFGPGLVKRFRPDLQAKFSDVLEHDDAIFDYIYHCNAQTPSGESAFKAMNKSFGWAKNPMINRVADIPKHVPMTLIYGSRSWMDSGTGYHVKYLRDESYVDVQVIRGAGHHVYADKPLPFNALVSKICESVDRNILPTIRIQNRRPSSSSSTSAETVADKIEDKTEKSVNDD